MRGLLVVMALGGTGCQLFFSLDAPADAVDAPADGPPPQRPFGCSPASLLTDRFTDTGMVNRPWGVRANGTLTTATETGSGVLVEVIAGFLEAIAEPYLELREQEFSVLVEHVDGTPNNGDRATLDLVTEDGRHRLSYGLVADANRVFRLIAEYQTFDDEGNATTSTIGGDDHTGNEDPLHLVIRHQGEVTTFLAASPGIAPVVKFTTDLAPLDWIAYMRPILSVTASNDGNRYLFREFNGSGAPVGEACPASAIHETFAPLSTEWQRVSDNCAIVQVASGILRMNFSDGDAAHACVIHTSTVYDLRDHQIELEVFEVLRAQATSMRVELEIETRTSRARLRLDVDASKLLASYGDAGSETSVGELPINLASLRDTSVWRISGTSDDRLRFEVGDGDTFVTLGATQANDVGTLDVVRVQVKATGNGVGAGAVTGLNEIRSK